MIIKTKLTPEFIENFGMLRFPQNRLTEREHFRQRIQQMVQEMVSTPFVGCFLKLKKKIKIKDEYRQ